MTLQSVLPSSLQSATLNLPKLALVTEMTEEAEHAREREEPLQAKAERSSKGEEGEDRPGKKKERFTLHAKCRDANGCVRVNKIQIAGSVMLRLTANMNGRPEKEEKR